MTYKTPRSDAAVNSDRIADRIMGELREQIVRGELPKGAKLPTERELTERYGVSGPTVREAVRGLSAMGLVNVRHGSGAYVAADPGLLIAMSLGTVIQLEKLGIGEILGTAECIQVHGARLSAECATEADKALLLSSVEQLQAVDTVPAAVEALRAFHDAIVMAAHNPLLRVMNSFLSDLAIELGLDVMGDDLAAWRRVLDAVAPLRVDLVQAIVRGDVLESTRLAETYHKKATALVISAPKAERARLKDPQFQSLLLRLLTRLGAH